MRSKSIICAFCSRPIDLPSGFHFALDDGSLVHPDCMAYTLERGPVPPGSTLLHTCGEPLCVRPDHLLLITGKVK